MKILIINKHEITGGAGITAWRLQEQLEKSFHSDNYILVGIKKSNNKYVISTRKAGLQNFIEKVINFGLCKLGLQYVYFPFSTRNILKVAKEINPDIISLHNIHSGYFKTELLKPLSKIAPIVWTLHDMWGFTASAAHTFGDTSWVNLRSGKNERKNVPKIGLPTGNWLIKRKKKIYDSSKFTVVTPSIWLQNLAKKSPLFSEKNIYQIYNGINLESFTPSDKEKAKTSLDLDPNVPVITVSAEKLMGNEFKGGDDLINVLKLLDKENRKICLLTLGNGKIPIAFNNIWVKEMGYISSEQEYINCLRATDIFIHTTRAESQGMVMVEASACGIPVITVNVGACPEVIRDGENGYVVVPNNPKEFVISIKKLIDNPVLYQSFSKNARRIAEQYFDVKDMAEKYMELFEHLISKDEKLTK